MQQTPGRETIPQEDNERVKVEKNSKGYNWSYSVIRKPGQTWKDVLAECDELEDELVKRYGKT